MTTTKELGALAGKTQQATRSLGHGDATFLGIALAVDVEAEGQLRALLEADGIESVRLTILGTRRPRAVLVAKLPLPLLAGVSQ